jgi:CheY-like chemotaxis protein
MGINQGNTRVFIADDQPEVRSALRLLLEQQPGLAVTGEAADGISLLLWLAGNKTDILLLDWELPGKMGGELIPQLRAIYPDLQIIAMDSKPQVKKDAAAAGACEFLGKNEPPERLIEVIEHCRPGIKPVAVAPPAAGGDEYYYSDFNAVRVSGAFRIEVNRAESYRVSLVADDPYHVQIDKEGDTLRIGRRGFDWMFPLHRQPEVKIFMPDLRRFILTGASTGKITGFQSNNDLVVELSGASRMEMLNIAAASVQIKSHGASILTGDLKAANETRIELLGAGRIDLSGSSRSMNLNATGASRAELEKFHLEGAYVKLMGASRATVFIDGRLNVSLAGASNLYWVGNPAMGDIEIIGASNIRRK